jgi:hypothetical protein
MRDVTMDHKIVDEELDDFKANMRWSPEATEHEKSLVHGNLNAFAAKLRTRIIDEREAGVCIPELELRCETCGGNGYCPDRCPDCDGAGKALTPFGAEVLGLVSRRLRLEHRGS